MAASNQGTYVPRFEVTVGGQTFGEAGGRIADLMVESTLDGADRFSLTMNTPFDQEHQEFVGFDWDAFATDTSVEVATGWGADGSLTDLFVGKIHRLSTNFAAGSGPTVGVSGYGLIHDMMQGTTDRSWAETTVGDVVQEVVSEYFGDTTVEGSGMQREKIYQHDESDYRFVQRLADRYGYQFYTKRNAVHFVPRTSMGGSSVATLHWGSSLESFSADINEAQEVKEVEVRHWDMENEKEIVGTASGDAKNDKKEVFRIPCSTEDEATEIAESKLDALSGSRVTASGQTTRGIPSLTAGATVTIEEMGSKFSKEYYVTKATHRVGSSGYRTSFDVTEVPE